MGVIEFFFLSASQMVHVQPALSHEDPYVRKAAYTTLAVACEVRACTCEGPRAHRCRVWGKKRSLNVFYTPVLFLFNLLISFFWFLTIRVVPTTSDRNT